MGTYLAVPYTSLVDVCTTRAIPQSRQRLHDGYEMATVPGSGVHRLARPVQRQIDQLDTRANRVEELQCEILTGRRESRFQAEVPSEENQQPDIGSCQRIPAGEDDPPRADLLDPRNDPQRGRRNYRSMKTLRRPTVRALVLAIGGEMEGDCDKPAPP